MMRGTMDGKSTVELPSVTVVEQPDVGRKKSFSVRKRVIVAVTCAVVTAMIITGVILTIWFFLDSTVTIVKNTYEFKKEDGKSVKEDVDADVKENFVRYHLTDDNSEITVIDDFNRELQVLKVKEAAGSKCYVLTLNHSGSAVPEALLNASAPRDKVETEKVNYKVAEKAIKDKGLLGTQGQDLCDNLDVHWMTPSCDDVSDEPDNDNGREKRGIYCRRYYYCYWRLYCNSWHCYWRYLCYSYVRCYYYY